MSLPLWILVFVLGLAATVIASELFIQKAEDAGKKAKLSPFIQGIVISTFLVALPELLISLLATWKNYSSVVPTYVTGANLINLLLIPGLMALAGGTMVAQKDSTLRQLPMLFVSIALVLVLARDGQVELWEGVALLLAFVSFVLTRHQDYKQGLWQRVQRLFTFGNSSGASIQALLWLLVLGAGAYGTVTGMIQISESQSWNPGYLASSAVALAVSTPELVLAYRAGRKGQTDSVVEVLIASTVVNSTLVLALPTLLKTVNVLDDVVSISTFYLLLAAIAVSLLLLLRKWVAHQGAIFILFYVVFLIQFLNPLFS